MALAAAVLAAVSSDAWLLRLAVLFALLAAIPFAVLAVLPLAAPAVVPDVPEMDGIQRRLAELTAAVSRLERHERDTAESAPRAATTSLRLPLTQQTMRPPAMNGAGDGASPTTEPLVVDLVTLEDGREDVPKPP